MHQVQTSPLLRVKSYMTFRTASSLPLSNKTLNMMETFRLHASLKNKTKLQISLQDHDNIIWVRRHSIATLSFKDQQYHTYPALIIEMDKLK